MPLGYTRFWANAFLAVTAWLLAGASLPRLPERDQGFAFHQPLVTTVLDVEAVPSGVITALAFETNGLLWIGSQNGLIRYDGYTTQSFVHEAGDSSTLAGEYIRCIALDSQQQLWVGTQSDGVSVIDTRSLKISNHRHQPATDGSIGKGTVFALATNSEGEVFIGTDGGLSQLLPNAAGFRNDRHDASNARSLIDDRVRSLLVARNGDLWVGTVSGLAVRRAGTSAYSAVAAAADDPKSLRGKEIRGLFEAEDGSIWVGTRLHGAAVMKADGTALRWIDGQENRRALPHAWVYTIAQPRADEVWLGTAGGGIAVVSVDSLQIVRVIEQQAGGDGLGHNLVSALATDRSGQLWIGTWGGGLQRTSAAQGAFRMLREPVLTDADVHSILELRDGRILVGTFSNGIDILDRQRGLIGGYRIGPGATDLPSGIVTALAESADGSIWAGTQQGGVLRLQAGSPNWQRFDQASGLPSALVHSLWLDAHDELWVGTAAGLARFDAQSSRFTAMHDDAGEVYSTRVIRIAEDRRGRLWLATDDGLGLYDPQVSGVRSVRRVASHADSLSSNDVNGVLIDRGGRLWVDTAEGLDLLLSEEGDHFLFDHVSTRVGRPNQTVGGNLVEDERGRIWTDSFVLDPQNARIDLIDEADGVDLGTHWTGAVAKTRDGLLLFGGTRGLVIVDPAHYVPWTFAPLVVATELRVDGVARSIAPLAASITLQPEERDFNVSFAALDLSKPLANLYRYRLAGTDTDWIQTTATHRIASYGNLWPGRYTLEVRGSNRISEWSPHTLSIPITVLPQFWQTPTFMTLAAFALLAAIYAGYRLQLRSVVARARHLEQLVTARTIELEAKNAALETAYAQVERAAVTDPLTGLGNRRSIANLASSEHGAGAAYAHRACMLIDIDRFKAINDLHGHAVGDSVLRAIASLLRAGVPDSAALARWGGEEFLIVAHVADMADAWRLAEGLRLSIERMPVDLGDGHPLPCTCSIGIALFAPPGPTAPPRFESVVAIADAALYRAKRSGRNRCIGLEVITTPPADFESVLREDPARWIAGGVMREWLA